MILSINFSIRTTVLLFAVLLCFSSAAAQNDTEDNAAVAERAGGSGPLKIAVYPVFNLSGSTAPLAALRSQMIEDLKDADAALIADDVLDSAITKNRIRYVGGLDKETAQAMRQDAAADCVLITSLELYSDVVPPKIALTARLVSTESQTAILWIDGIGMAGDDAPGLLALSLVEDPQVLMQRAVRHLAQSLTFFLSGQGKRAPSRSPKGKFAPEVVYRKDVLSDDKMYRVAVVPFFNPSASTRASSSRAPRVSCRLPRQTTRCWARSRRQCAARKKGCRARSSSTSAGTATSTCRPTSITSRGSSPTSSTTKPSSRWHWRGCRPSPLRDPRRCRET